MRMRRAATRLRGLAELSAMTAASSSSVVLYLHRANHLDEKTTHRIGRRGCCTKSIFYQAAAAELSSQRRAC